MKRIIKFILPMACIAAVLVSCSEKELDGKYPSSKLGDGVVALTVGNDAAQSKAMTSGSRTTRSIVASLAEETGIEGLVLEEAVTSLDENSVSTKGTPVFTQNFADVYAAGFMATDVYKCSNKEKLSAFCNALFVKRENSSLWYHDYEEPLPEKALFFFTAPASLPAYIGTPSYNPTDGTPSVQFTLVPAKYPVTAVEQQDVLFATSEIEPGKSSNVNFFHAFAQVKFKQGTNDGMLQITKIEMSNLLTSGTCKVTPVAGAKSASVSVWSQNEKTYGTFSQEYDGTTNYDEGQTYFGSDFYKEGTYENNLNINGDKKATTTFMCVPQSFSESDANHVMVTITYTCNGATKTTQVDFSKALKNKSWEPGKLYTYSLTIADLGVTVEDNVSDDTKDNVVITNVGNSTGYIRAAIVANWVKNIDGETVVVKTCAADDGAYTDFGADWKKGSDGYWYYKYGVKGGKATKQAIFTSYTADMTKAPVIGAYMEMHVMAQIVAVRSAWDATLPEGLVEDAEE